MATTERHIFIHKGHRLTIIKTIGEHGYSLNAIGRKTTEYLDSLPDDEYEQLWDDIAILPINELCNKYE